MENKEVIIDGVNVSECRFLEPDLTCYGTTIYTLGATTDEHCKDCTDCYYKQLRRKTQECEELNKKLYRKKSVIECASCPSYSYCDNDIEPKCTRKHCFDINDCEYKQLNRYKQALEEIKKLLNHCVKYDICTLCEYADRCRDEYDYCSYDVNKVVLTIINEVLNG